MPSEKIHVREQPSNKIRDRSILHQTRLKRLRISRGQETSPILWIYIAFPTPRGHRQQMAMGADSPLALTSPAEARRTSRIFYYLAQT
jgi:hypothetical protein